MRGEIWGDPFSRPPLKGALRRGGVLDITTLFSGDEGGFYDPNDLSTVWTDTGGTTAASVGDQVARIDAAAGTFDPMIQATLGQRPYLRLDATTGFHYLEFDQADDTLETSAVQTMGAPNGHTCVAVDFQGDAQNSALLMYGTNTSTGGMGIETNNVSTGWTPKAFSAGATAVQATGTDQSPAKKLVVRGRADYANDVCEVYVNGSLDGSNYADQGASASNNRTLKVGEQFAESINANWYGGVIINRALTAKEVSDMEASLASRMGLTL